MSGFEKGTMSGRKNYTQEGIVLGSQGFVEGKIRPRRKD
jgi:hypothetical protein